jgi:hypothetical protein
MDKKDFAFDKVNYLLLAVGMIIVVIGFLLMTGPASTDTAFEPDIFSARRTKLAPLVCLFGFVSMIYAVVRKPKDAVQKEAVNA